MPRTCRYVIGSVCVWCVPRDSSYSFFSPWVCSNQGFCIFTATRSNGPKYSPQLNSWMTMAMPSENPENSALIPLRFPRFPELPSELRLKIWQTAIDQVSGDRAIHVKAYHQLQVTLHSCFCTSGRFCGLHGSCPLFRYSNGLGNWGSHCMTDGYFVSTNQVSSPKVSSSSFALAGLSIASHESRRTVLRLYNKILQVYEGPWQPGMRSYFVRCRPETDILVIHAVPDFSVSHHVSEGLTTERSLQRQREAKLQHFPRDITQFARFKDIISGFQHVAIFSRIGYEPDQLSEDPNTPRHLDLLRSNDAIALLGFFTSLKDLYLWPDPAYWPHAWESAEPIGDIMDLKTAREAGMRASYGISCRDRWAAVGNMQDRGEGFLEDYNGNVEVQNNHFVADDSHWTPQSKPLKQIGCFCPASWLRWWRSSILLVFENT